MSEEYTADNIYSIMEGSTDGIRKIIDKVFVDRNEVYSEIVNDLEEMDQLFCFRWWKLDLLLEKYREKIK